MIIFFGPAGAGKSVQGQILAARHGGRWLSAGQLLRDSRDPELIEQMRRGELVANDRTNQLMEEALLRAKKADNVVLVILDGYPRHIDQAHWLITMLKKHDLQIKLAIVLEVPRAELLKRLALRGRPDDTPDAIEERLQIYRKEMYPILTYLSENGVPIAHIDGVGTVGQVHDRIEAEIEDGAHESKKSH